ncbi:MAG: FlgD immunoglobulin-like domain containing protein [bacterium]
MQYWLQLFQIESTDAAYLLSRLDTPAARQMLVYHHTDPPGATGQHDALRDDFLADIATVGDYPANPRKVAVANGSGHMANQGFLPDDQLISYEYSSFLVDIVGNVWAVPDGTSQLIFDGLINRIWPLPDDQLVVTVAGTLPFDNAPGGSRASMAQMDTTAVPYGDIVALHDSHCFIPTISALALDTADPFYDIAGDPGLLSLTPFDAVYYPVENQEHVAITAESRVWFLDEIRRDLSAISPPVTPVATTAMLRGIQPNPFNPWVTIRYQLFTPARVSLRIYDLAGRTVRDLVDGSLVQTGEYTATWDGRDQHGRDLASGTYLCRLETGTVVMTRKMLLTR